MPASSRGRAGRDRPFLVEPLGEKGYAAIAYQVHFPAESWHTGDIDFAVALDLDEFADLEHLEILALDIRLVFA
jgi:hypothetical protein